MGTNNIVLNKLFTQHIFSDLVMNHRNGIYCSVIQRYVDDNESKNNGELISEIYKYMAKNYRNEYFYQNTLFNKLLLGRHSINTTTALTQIPIGKSKADFILINGKAVVYEIKTGLDNFERLNTQLADYYKAFNHVCVVTSEDNYAKLLTILSESPVGIYVLTKRNTLSLRKEPQPNNESLEYAAIFNVLRKKEFENIIIEHFKELPQTSPVLYYEECYKMFSEISIDEVYAMALKQLKKRNRIIKEYFMKVPYELKSLMYFYNASCSDYSGLNCFLKEKYRG